MIIFLKKLSLLFPNSFHVSTSSQLIFLHAFQNQTNAALSSLLINSLLFLFHRSSFHDSKYNHFRSFLFALTYCVLLLIGILIHTIILVSNCFIYSLSSVCIYPSTLATGITSPHSVRISLFTLSTQSSFFLENQIPRLNTKIYSSALMCLVLVFLPLVIIIYLFFLFVFCSLNLVPHSSNLMLPAGPGLLVLSPPHQAHNPTFSLNSLYISF